MSDDRNGGDLVRRAQQVAAGFADVGLSQAEEMLRRVSPEGRAAARRRRLERARRARRIWLQIGAAVLVALFVTALFRGLGGAAAGADLLFPALLAIAAALIWRSNRWMVAATPARLAVADLHGLAGETGRWLEEQRRALPAPAVQLTDQLQRRFDSLGPQLAQLRPDEPAAEAVRKLLATELPQLVERYQAVPPPLRAQPNADGRSPDAHLLHGLQLIDGEVARMTDQLARGALDEVATQGRYLELKYRGEGEL
jgi:hypothetical protein